MTEFNKEEISLCKQVAEKYRKKIGEGDWYISDGSDYKTGWSNPMLNINDYEPVKVRLIGIGDETNRNDVPLWTISDCLEFLWGKDFLYIEISSPGVDELFGENWQVITKHKDTPTDCSAAYVIQYAKTPLEACLKAVLAVLEEGT